MRRTTYYLFQSATTLGLRGITSDPDGATLSATDGPWTLERQIAPDEPWPLDVDHAVVEFGIEENGFYFWGLVPRHASPNPVIESDRVEGTAVFDLKGHRIGTDQAPANREGERARYLRRCDLRGLPGSRGPPSHRSMGEAHLRYRAAWVPHRHYRGAGSRCSRLLWE